MMRGEPELRRKSNGRWLPIRQGGMLLLHNHYGLSRLLNLGRARTLYADMPLKGGRPSLGVRFYLDAPDSAPVQVMGVLESRKGLPILHEGGPGWILLWRIPPRCKNCFRRRSRYSLKRTARCIVTRSGSSAYVPAQPVCPAATLLPTFMLPSAKNTGVWGLRMEVRCPAALLPRLLPQVSWTLPPEGFSCRCPMRHRHGNWALPCGQRTGRCSWPWVWRPWPAYWTRLVTGASMTGSLHLKTSADILCILEVNER